MAIGLILSLAVFFWALKNGQFKEQQRARFLALKELPEKESIKKTLVSRIEVYGLWIMALGGLLLTGLILINALLHS